MKQADKNLCSFGDYVPVGQGIETANLKIHKMSWDKPYKNKAGKPGKRIDDMGEDVILCGLGGGQ